MKMEPESEGGAQLAPSRSELKVGFSAPPIDNIGVGRRISLWLRTHPDFVGTVYPDAASS
jgi:hypothetical protein